jgi:uncharacterized protein YbjT (DUF2867 family)
MRTCAILGATGLVGSRVVALALGAYDGVRALVRRPLARAAPRLEARVVDFDALAEQHEALAVDHVYCCLGTTIRKAGSEEAFRRVDHDYPLAAARAAERAGARQFLVVTAVGADAKSRIFYNRVKGELEDALGALSFREGLTIVRPSMLLGAREESRPAEAIAGVVMRATRSLFSGPLVRYRAVDADDVARALLRASREPASGVRILEGASLFAMAKL